MSDQKSELEKAAEAWANERCPEQGPEFIVWCMCKEDYLNGAHSLLEKLEELLRAERTKTISLPLARSAFFGFEQAIIRARELCGK